MRRKEPGIDRPLALRWDERGIFDGDGDAILSPFFKKKGCAILCLGCSRQMTKGKNMG